MANENTVDVLAAISKGGVADAKTAISNVSEPNKVTRAQFDLFVKQRNLGYDAVIPCSQLCSYDTCGCQRTADTGACCYASG
jgi:hypothetical protein